jgi:hypothetical protein
MEFPRTGRLVGGFNYVTIFVMSLNDELKCFRGTVKPPESSWTLCCLKSRNFVLYTVILYTDVGINDIIYYIIIYII